MSWKAFGQAVLHAAIGGAAVGAAQVTSAGQFSWKTLGSVVAASAVTSVVSLFTPKPASAPAELPK
jgi:hypothetical protein